MLNQRVKALNDSFNDSPLRFISKLNKSDFPKSDASRFLDIVMLGDVTYRKMSELNKLATQYIYDEKYSKNRIFSNEDKLTIDDMLRTSLRDVFKEYLNPSKDGFKHSMSFFSNPVIARTLSVFSELNKNKFSMLNLGDNIPEEALKELGSDKRSIYLNKTNIGSADDPLTVLINIASLGNGGLTATISKEKGKLKFENEWLSLSMNPQEFSKIDEVIETALKDSIFGKRFTFKDNTDHSMLNNINGGTYFMVPVINADSGVVTGFDTYNVIFDRDANGNSYCYIKAVERNAFDLGLTNPISQKANELDDNEIHETIDLRKLFKENDELIKKGIEL